MILLVTVAGMVTMMVFVWISTARSVFSVEASQHRLLPAAWSVFSTKAFLTPAAPEPRDRAYLDVPESACGVP